MAKTKAEVISAPRLKSFVERVEKLDEERRSIGADIRDVLAEAKGVGYDVKTIRWLVQERRIDAAERSERDTLRDTYAHALGMAVELVQVEGLSLREAGRITGVSKSSIHRALSAKAASQEGQQADPATGEITDTPREGEAEQQSNGPAVAASPTCGIESSGGVEGHASQTAEVSPGIATPAAACERQRGSQDQGSGATPSLSAAGVEPGPLDTQPEDTLEIPAHLKRTRAAA